MMALKTQPSSARRETANAIGESLSKTPGDETMTFPKEFEKSLSDFIDRRFIVILALTIVVDFGSIAYFVSTAPAEMSESDAERFRKKFVELVRDKAGSEREAKFVEAPPLKDLPPELMPKNVSDGPASVSGRRAGAAVSPGGSRETVLAGGSAETHTAPGASGRRTREDISQAASRAGVLALLTGKGDAATGRAAEDVLSGNKTPMANLDEALTSAGGLRRGSTRELGTAMGPGGDAVGNGNDRSREIRGSRATNVGGIDALVQGLGEGKSQSVQRSGGLEVGNHEPLIEEPSEDGRATGSRDRDLVAAVVARHTSAIQFCYQREVRRHPNLRGKLVVRFVITPQGTIAGVTVLSSTLSNPTVESCVVERIKRWDDFGAIDPSKGNTTFRQVYTFGY